MKKPDIDLRTAMSTGETKRKVAVITAAFFVHLMNAIVETGEVHVEGFGRFRLITSSGRRASTERLTQGNFKKGQKRGEYLVEVEKKYTVTFSKAAPFRQRVLKHFGKAPIKEQVMEKYGVDESVDAEKLEKRANEGCPACGKELIKHGSVLMCPTHGSEPFENKK